MAEKGIHFPLVPTCEQSKGRVVASIFLREPNVLPKRHGYIRIGNMLPDDIPRMLENLVLRLPTEQRKYVGAIALDRLCEDQTHNDRVVVESLGVVAFCGATATRFDYKNGGKEKIVNGFGKARIDIEGTGDIWPVIYPQLDPRIEARNPYKCIVQASAAPHQNKLWVALRGVAPVEAEIPPVPAMLVTP